mmetsp:Transcript_5129/g.11814  ORF Transcript_5129/g.11814 Transcript_5129/m.11814 type:complete len:146 (+) Transcript_5129:1-438(+)
MADWKLLYSTARHGISINTFFRRAEMSTSPSLLVVEDTKKHVFGCFASLPWRQGHNYYGTGESFVFSVRPSFKMYRWSRKNDLFQLSDTACLAVGGGGHFALWLDNDFLHGSSGTCSTYDSECLASTTEFQIVYMEVWALESDMC